RPCRREAGGSALSAALDRRNLHGSMDRLHRHGSADSGYGHQPGQSLPLRRLNMLRVLLTLAVLPIFAIAAIAQEPDPDLARTRPTRFNASFSGGSGLVQSVSPDTLPFGEGAVGASVMNFDRDPGDIDLFEYSFQGVVGFRKRTEIFARIMPWLRANSADLQPVRFPVPPL